MSDTCDKIKKQKIALLLTSDQNAFYDDSEHDNADDSYYDEYVENVYDNKSLQLLPNSYLQCFMAL